MSLEGSSMAYQSLIHAKEWDTKKNWASQILEVFDQSNGNE
jgi:hypothetical protein